MIVTLAGVAVLLVVVHEDAAGTVDGFMTAWRMELAGYGNKEPFGWMDIIHTYNLSVPEATDLANFLCASAKAIGWQGLQTPFIPYFDPTPFKKAKFIFYPKRLWVNIYPLNPTIELPDHVDSFYFDWR